VAMGDGGAAALAPGCAATGAGHLGRRAGLVDEDEALRFQIRLAGEPSAAVGDYIGPILLGGVRCLFFSVTPWRWKNRQTIEGSGR
jgi:hypothetical protein